jgi:hypothetical protein
MAFQLLFGERSLTVVAAAFGDPAAAHTIATSLARRLGKNRDSQVAVVEPADTLLSIKVEPESEGIKRTAIRSHLALGLFGLVAGLALGIAAVHENWAGAAQTPVLTTIVAGMLGIFAGLLLGGLLTLRPDRGEVADEVQRAAANGLWTVVAHPRNHAEVRTSSAMLTQAGGRLIRSL